jgi:hypothetical protein
LTADTSGFLSATKLSGASLMMGKDATNDLTDVLASVDQFASVSSGNLVINGNSVAIDVETDSLSNVLDKINTSNAGVNALLEDGVVKLENEDNEQVLSLSDNTGFLNAVELAPGVFEPVDAIASQKRQIRGLSNSDAKQLERNIEKFGERANEFFSDNFLAELPSEKIQSVREELFSLFSSAQSSDGDETSSIFTINDNKIEITENLEQTLKNNPNDFNQIFFGQSDNSEETFLERLISTIDANLARTQSPLDLGSIVNILV